jgi:hypothetical protein
MPNEERYFCGTCWFNLGHKDVPRDYHTGEPKSYLCVIRKVEISDPLRAYCANHTRGVPLKVAMPIGPIYQDDALGNRKVWFPLEDTPENRLFHLECLRNIGNIPMAEHPLGKTIFEIIMNQVIEWRESRAIPYLRRIAGLPTQRDNLDKKPALHENVAIEVATRALEKLESMKT